MAINFRTTAAAVASIILLVGCKKDNAYDVGPKPAQSITQGKLADPDNPPMECPDGMCPGMPSGDPNNSITFSTSVGRGAFSDQVNPNGDIVQLATIYDRTDVPDGWYLIDKNLNEGCTGGAFNTGELYLIFTRSNDAAIKHLRGNDKVDRYYPIKAIDAYAKVGTYGPRSSGYNDLIARRSPYYAGTGRIVVDLNDRVGGDAVEGAMIHSSDASIPSIEIGVLRGLNNPDAQPPNGWTRVNQNLNQGAGGDYVWFCYKNR